jgi:putative flippase GtrA
MTRFLRFCVVGIIGLGVDIAALTLAVQLLGTGPYLGRVLSYLAAATATWALNRRWTFVVARDTGLHREWAHYLALNAVGAAANYSVYALGVLYLPLVRERLWVGVAAGSIAGMFFNYTAMRLWIFAPGRSRP